MPGQPKYGMGRKGSVTTDLTLPSMNDDGEHNVCKVRRADPQALIAAGILDDFDSLTRLVQLKINEIEGDGAPKRSDAETVAAIAASKDDLMAGLALVDKIVEYIVVEPRVVRPVARDTLGQPLKVADPNGVLREIPLRPDEREEDVLYTDDVDMEDRMFILSYSMDGGKDLESFRAGTAELVASVVDVGEVPVSALRPLGA